MITRFSVPDLHECTVNLVKKLLNRGGLRCEILTDGTISVNDSIKQI